MLNNDGIRIESDLTRNEVDVIYEILEILQTHKIKPIKAILLLSVIQTMFADMEVFIRKETEDEDKKKNRRSSSIKYQIKLSLTELPETVN